MVERHLRISAYAVCVEGGRILLARWTGGDGKQWGLPGGGLQHGEDPYDAAVREVEEETGYTVEIERLLGIDSLHQRHPRWLTHDADFHGVRVVYAGRVTGGELRHEVNGSTDLAAWIELDRLAGLDRAPLVDTALALHTERPPHGRAAGPR
ncbi:NUDIX hydrolase [Streptomyces rugosispiralis]|uniref:NUDIX hydrolase n=1 Tax=Streptomyces rugosispiralis TaxID=2967341 RepID=A0ABT1UUY1_9ACTN|nr:NUDIX hydrolase [Streptomyces rugosispiralis]MCQ8188922.1 NUDIX hydrolase [Streptomyces rugosispiralis]